MELIFWIFISIGICLCFFYFFLITKYCYGWIKTKEVEPGVDSAVYASVIVAARNEEKVLENCINSILAQDYSRENFEIIIVDDHSDDSTSQIILDYSKKYKQIKYLQLPETKIGKKKAIHAAIEIAKGELIITTDADCEMGTKWLSRIISFYTQTNSKMIVGAVAFHKEKSLFEKMQSLEFLALMASGAGSLYFNKAIMCNGANLAYAKSVYLEVGGFAEIEEKASGDDVLLMYKIREKYPKGIQFLKSEEAVVFTKAKEKLADFIQQRKRWASKGFFALNIETQRVSLLIYLFNFYLVFMPLIGGLLFLNTPFYLFFLQLCFILVGIKCFIDFLLLFLSASFFKKKRFLLLFLPEQIIYMIYVVLLGLLGSIGKYEWKGRKIN
ncbi:MAG: glycosyltransferase [Bacteroidetes bacterium]|nr:glycosyltransferase [Bacteroidota bacterium]